jgi:hypothetical protein
MVMRRSVLSALSLTLALTACGFSDASDGNVDAPSPTGISTSSPAAGSEPEDAGVAPNERGNIPAQIGEEVVIRPAVDSTEPPLLTLSIDEVTIDPVCDDDSEVPPDNGHYVAIRMRATAAPQFDPRAVTVIGDYDFTVIGPDGSAFSTPTEAGRDCFGPPRLIQNMRIGPGMEYQGWMVLDVPVTSGVLVYAPGDTPNGWEWQF